MNVRMGMTVLFVEERVSLVKNECVMRRTSESGGK